MALRPEIVIPFNYDETWIGGAYYITNLISALRLLPWRKQPRLWICTQTSDSFEFIAKRTDYPHLVFLGPPEQALLKPGRYQPTLSALRNNRRAPWFSTKFDLVFPYPIDAQWRQTACWIPDFQDKRLPDLFSQQELDAREAQHRSYFTQYRHLVLSSESAKADFLEFYPEASVKIHVLHFAVFPNADRPTFDFAMLRQKYALPERYFYAPNQFWIHKNHETLIRAVALLSEQGVNVNVVFSGKEHDARAPGHYEKLLALTTELGIADRVRFLGFIPRDEQMEVFQHAACIVQPSLFEGWSTVIEDAKSLSKYVIASDIPVHREQLDVNAEFFDPLDPVALATAMSRHAETPPVVQPVDYDRARLTFATRFMEIVREVRRTDDPGNARA